MTKASRLTRACSLVATDGYSNPNDCWVTGHLIADIISAGPARLWLAATVRILCLLEALGSRMTQYNCCICIVPIQSDNCKAYVRAELFVAGGDEKWESRVVHTLSSNDPTLGNFVWRERIDWKDEKDELSFVR